MNDPYIYLVQRVYSDEVVTQGPFQGRLFTGWHRVSRYDRDTKKLQKFWLPPCHELEGGTNGFSVTQINLAIGASTATQDEVLRPNSGQILYGNPIHIGIEGISRALRAANLMESDEGYGG